MKYTNFLLLLSLLYLLVSCKQEGPRFDRPKAPYEVATLDEDGGLNMVVEIPAGTNKKFEYDKQAGRFVQDTLPDGSERVIQFLPYPGNYGFIPSTLMDKARGGDGDPLDILVIGESAARGSQISVAPIGALLLSDQGELDTKIIAIPSDSGLRTLPATNYLELLLEYPAAHRIVEEWFLNYKGIGVTNLIRWEDEGYAWAEIEKWRLK
ncbi:MAG: inorganic diphosphatase [Bacteroidota bacterium]